MFLFVAFEIVGLLLLWNNQGMSFNALDNFVIYGLIVMS